MHLYNSARHTARMRAAKTLEHHNLRHAGKGVGSLGVHEETSMTYPDPVEHEDEGEE